MHRTYDVALFIHDLEIYLYFIRVEIFHKPIQCGRIQYSHYYGTGVCKLAGNIKSVGREEFMIFPPTLNVNGDKLALQLKLKSLKTVKNVNLFFLRPNLY